MAALALSGCGGLLGGSGEGGRSGAIPDDPTPLDKCSVAAGRTNPLVTEWPASEKAHLETAWGSGAVAVAYSGCEMRIIDGCRLGGVYAWRRTTLASDTVRISNTDELYAKLPIGAVGLEGELSQSGSLAVRTTVAGQLRLDAAPGGADAAACSEATHYISAISVGAFKLFGGGRTTAGGGASIAGTGAGARTDRSDSVLREAGNPARCSDAEDTAPHPECASPIQVFLAPLAGHGGAPEASPARTGAVRMRFTPPDEDSSWALRDRAGNSLCALPCEAWVPPNSGYTLLGSYGGSVEQVAVPAALPFEPGASVDVDFEPESGSPLLSKLAFYGVGVPAGVLGGVFLIWGGVQALSGPSACEDEPGGCSGFDSPGTKLGIGAFYASASLATFIWFSVSNDERFEMRRSGSGPRASRAPRLMLGPGFVSGTF